MIGRLLFRIVPSNIRILLGRNWGMHIGNNCIIQSCNLGSEPYLISIGNHCEITSGVVFITHDGGTWIFRGNKNFNCTKYGRIVIKDNCMIGINSIILPNVTIGPNSIIGAGSVITKDIPPNTVYAGNPGKFICTTEEYLIKCTKKNTGKIPKNNKKETLMKLFNINIIN